MGSFILFTVLLAVSPTAGSSPGGMVLHTGNGLVRLTAGETALYQAVDGYLHDRIAMISRPYLEFPTLD